MRKYLFVFLLILLPQICLATVIHVPGDSGTIQSAIDGSSAGDTVLVDPGTYFENINFLGKNIYLASQFIFSGDSLDISATIIDGQAAGSVVTFNSGEDNTATLTGFTITNGMADHGGGIYCSASNPTISNNIIAYNGAAITGGGLHCENSTPIINGNTIKSNSSLIQGGGLYFINSNCGLSNITFLANYATAGGGVYILNSTISIINSSFTLNYVQVEGGALDCEGSESSLTVEYCSLDGNSTGYNQDQTKTADESTHQGGAVILKSGPEALIKNCNFRNNNSYTAAAIFSISCSLTANNCSFMNNSAENTGGAIYSEYCDLTVKNCHFEQNSAVYIGTLAIAHSPDVTVQGTVFNHNSVGNWGGGLSFWQSSGLVTGCTFNANSAVAGSAVHLEGSDPVFENCIFAFGLDGVPVRCGTELEASNPQFSCCDVYGNAAGNWVDCLADFEGINGNIELDPLFCDPANSNLSIQYSSPCAPVNNDCGVLMGARPPQNCTLLPLQAVILIDRSGSMFLTNALGESRLDRAKSQAKSDINKLLDLDDEDYFGAFEVAVMYFNADGIILLQDYTSDSEVLYTAIDNIPGPRHDTPLAAAMCQAHCTLKSTEPGQKLLFTFTDGLENQSQSFDMCSLCEPCNQYMSSGWNFDCGPDNPGSCTDWQLCLYQKFAQSALTNVHYYGEPINPFSKAAGSEGLEDLYFLKATAEGSSGTFYYHSDISTVCGDANYDGNLNIADAIWLINYVFSLGDPPTLMSAGDPNCDSKVNVSDAVYLINYVFTGGEAPCDPNGDGIPDCQLY